SQDSADSRDAFEGDECLADSCMLIHDGLLSRIVTQSVAEGEIGRVWEGLKRMLFSFAGSSHHKYATYLLEMVCNLELESSPALREFFLRNWLVNPSGKQGHYQAGDLLQEHYNRELE
ncbi:uncharacterized protein B0H18DRAFT_843904, partial [Fomitopsis serialis]|uniref:uncharacterized protein n=1 Tax=Fomitopsis serialis TaxID=139415 RepID=UPI002008AFB9